MISAKFSGRFAKARLTGTRDELLAPTPTTRLRNVTPAEQSMMEQETDEFLKRVDSIQTTHGEDVLNLTAACKIGACH